MSTALRRWNSVALRSDTDWYSHRSLLPHDFVLPRSGYLCCLLITCFPSGFIDVVFCVFHWCCVSVYLSSCWSMDWHCQKISECLGHCYTPNKNVPQKFVLLWRKLQKHLHQWLQYAFLMCVSVFLRSAVAFFSFCRWIWVSQLSLNFFLAFIQNLNLCILLAHRD